jgi:hypothetical protein
LNFTDQDQPLEIEGFIVNYNVTNFRLDELIIDGAVPIFYIINDGLSFSLKNLTVKISFDYEFILDPPLLADIGHFWVQLEQVDFQLNFTTYMIDVTKKEQIHITGSSLFFDHPAPLVDIYGYADLGIVVNNTINTIAAVVKNRLQQRIGQADFMLKMELLINAFLLIVPNNIHLGGDLYLDGMLYDNPTYKAGEYMLITLETSLDNKKAPYNVPNSYGLPAPITTLNYELQLAVTEWFVNSAIEAVTATGKLEFSLPLGATNVKDLQHIIGTMWGYADSDPCITTIMLEMPCPVINMMDYKSDTTSFLQVPNLVTRWQCVKGKDGPLNQIVDIYWSN